jgi:hypothetical protein
MRYFLFVFAVIFPFVWVAVAAITAAATHKPFSQCVTSMYMDCRKLSDGG